MTTAAVSQPLVQPSSIPDLPAPPRQPPSGRRKAALFLAQLTREEAGQILTELQPREVESLTADLVRLGAVDLVDVDATLSEAHAQLSAGPPPRHGGEDFARQVLAAGFGKEKAEDVLARLNVAQADVPFGSLRGADVRQLVTFLKDEHPQLIALVLAHLPAALSAEALSALPTDQQATVAHRIATMDRTAPQMVRLVEDQLARRMGSLLRDDSTEVGGVDALVEIINRSSRPTERSILERLDSADPQLAEQIRAQMFVFEDIVTIDDRSLQQVLREVDATDLATALKSARTDVRDKVERNLSARAAENLAEEIDLLGPVRISSVEEAQAGIVATMRAMEERGELIIGRGDEELVD